MYLLHKHTYCRDWLMPSEAPDRCASRQEAMLTFREAFRHLVGRKPSSAQVRRFASEGTVEARSGDLTYSFSMTKEGQR